MPAAKKGVADFVAISPAELFDAASRSDAQHSIMGPARRSSLAFSGVAQYEIATQRCSAVGSDTWGMGEFRISDHPGSPSHEAHGEVLRMFEDEIPLPGPVKVAWVRYGGPQSGSRR
jgi:hypothetical protein